MRIISLRIFSALIALGVLWAVVPDARSDDATDWANQQAQAQRDREQAERDRQDRENWQNQIAQAQKEREDWYNQQAQAQKDAEAWATQQAQAQKDREEWLNLQAQAQPEAPAAAQPAVVTPPPAVPPPENRRGLSLFSMPGEKKGTVPLAADGSRKGSKHPKTYTVTIHHGSQVTQTTFVMQADGSWQPQ